MAPNWLDNIRQMIIDELEASRRWGFYVGKVTNALQTFRRTDVQPEWLDTEVESLERLVRIASPILDVIYKVGTRVAVISQDGIPEAGAILGAVTDDKQEPDVRTVWIRADLEQHAGFVEVGATKGVRLFVGPNPGDITPIDEKNIELEPATGGFILLGDGATAKLVKDTFLSFFDAHVHNDPVSGVTTAPTILTSAAPPGTYETTKVKGE